MTPRAPAATDATVREREADEDSSDAEAEAATGSVFFDSPYVDMWTMRGKVSNELVLNKQVSLVPMVSNRRPPSFYSHTVTTRESKGDVQE